MANIAWGKPRIWVKDIEDKAETNKWVELPTPVENSTELSAEKGDKLEARIEGGEYEDVKYKRSTYTLAFNIRKAKKRQAPFPSVDGVVDHHFAVLLQPEDPSVEGFYISSTTVNVDETFTAADGAMWVCQMEALKAAKGDTVKWGIVDTATSGKISFTEGSSAEAAVDKESVASSDVDATNEGKGGKPADAS